MPTDTDVREVLIDVADIELTNHQLINNKIHEEQNLLLLLLCAELIVVNGQGFGGQVVLFVLLI